MARILYVEDAPSIGGSVFSLLQLVRGLERPRYKPFVLFRHDLPARKDFESIGVATATWNSITGTSQKAPSSELPRPPAPFKRSGFYRLLHGTRLFAREQYANSRWLESWMRREGFSLLHANNSISANAAAIMAAGRAGISIVSHQRGFFNLSWLHALMARRVDRLLCVSDAVREHYIRQGLPRNKLQTVYNGIDTEVLAPRPKERRGELLVGWVGRIEPWKGGVTFIDAARLLASERRDLRFLMVGTGPEESRIRAIVAASPLLRDTVTLAGYRSDSRDLLADCDVFANTSIEPEPLSRSALEALAFGLPIAASNSGGNPEIVVDGENGFLFEPGNHAGLAEVIRRLADDAGLRSRLGAESRRRAETIFSAGRHRREIESVYAAIIST